MPLRFQSKKSFIHSSPQAPSKKEQTVLMEKGQRENTVALEIQFRIHTLLNTPGLDINKKLHEKLKYFQGLAFAGYHPTPEELKALSEEEGVVEKIRNFTWEILQLISRQRQKWENIGYNHDELIIHQDIEAVAELAAKLDGEERIIIFGSARLQQGDASYEGTKWLTRTLVDGLAHKDGTTELIITGGGPGNMEAANRGALEGAWNQYQRLMTALHKEEGSPEEIFEKISRFRNQMHSIGVGIIVPHEQSWNPHLQANLTIKSFSPRKVGLVSVVTGRSIKHEKKETPNGNGKRKPAIFGMKGGFGTLDELWEVSTLIQCKKMPRIPIFVVGKMSKIIKSTTTQLREMGTIKKVDLGIFTHCKDEIEALEKYLEYYNLSPNQTISNAMDERNFHIT